MMTTCKQNCENCTCQPDVHKKEQKLCTCEEMASALKQRDERIAELEREAVESDAVRMQLSGILTAVADTMKGRPEPLHQHSWHGLPEIASEFLLALCEAHIAIKLLIERASSAEAELLAAKEDAKRLRESAKEPSLLNLDLPFVSYTEFIYSRPTGKIKNDEVLLAINNLHNIANRHHSTRQLKEKLAHVVLPLIKRAILSYPSEDTRRLDWLERCCDVVSIGTVVESPGDGVRAVYSGDSNTGGLHRSCAPTLRAAIDSARAQQEQKHG